MPRIPKRLLALGGLAAAGGAVLRRRRAGRPTTPTPSPSAPTPPVASAGVTVASPIVAPPPPDAPGPSVSPTGPPATDTERAEAAEAFVPEPAPGVDALVEQETAAAAAEAAGIGGPRLDDAHGDPAFEAVYQAGGGEAEGFELAEEQLIENATHGDGRGDPSQDAFTPEREADEATAVSGEADGEKASEVVEGDTDAGPRER